MMAEASAMRDENLDVGEAAELQQTMRTKRVLALCGISGFVAGLAFAWGELGDGAFLSGTIPAWLAVAIALSYVVAMTWGSIAFKRSADEHEMQINIWGSAIGASALLLIYPPWWVLWRGGLIGEPVHEILFATLFIVAIGAYLWKKFR